MNGHLNVGNLYEQAAGLLETRKIIFGKMFATMMKRLLRNTSRIVSQKLRLVIPRIKLIRAWNPFALIFAVNLILFELFILDYYLLSCSFPVLGKTQMNGIIIADPQLTDHYSYKQSGLSLKLTQFYSDLYMKRNYKRILRKYKPEFCIFAGDLFDGGREWGDEDFRDELHRFQKIFNLNIKLTLGVAGNHDIGFGKTIINHAYTRYISTFGKLNSVTEIGDFSIIALDTIGLSGRIDSVAYKTADEFLESLKTMEVDPSRRILSKHC